MARPAYAMRGNGKRVEREGAQPAAIRPTP
jgi:hypothetical protein